MSTKKSSSKKNTKNCYGVTEQFLRQSTDDETFFSMTEEEFDARANRLAFKSLNGIVDAETKAADERAEKSMRKFFGVKKATDFSKRGNEIKAIEALLAMLK
jgi:hypothetical protein